MFNPLFSVGAFAHDRVSSTMAATGVLIITSLSFDKSDGKYLAIVSPFICPFFVSLEQPAGAANELSKGTEQVSMAAYVPQVCLCILHCVAN